jgi:hypothetical protein
MLGQEPVPIVAEVNTVFELRMLKAVNSAIEVSSTLAGWFSLEKKRGDLGALVGCRWTVFHV